MLNKILEKNQSLPKEYKRQTGFTVGGKSGPRPFTVFMIPKRVIYIDDTR